MVSLMRPWASCRTKTVRTTSRCCRLNCARSGAERSWRFGLLNRSSSSAARDGRPWGIVGLAHVDDVVLFRFFFFFFFEVVPFLLIVRFLLVVH